MPGRLGFATASPSIVHGQSISRPRELGQDPEVIATASAVHATQVRSN
jgi:hypothetical protein